MREWRCNTCEYKTTSDPRRSKIKAHCPVCKGRKAWLKMFDQCPCGTYFHSHHYGVKTCSKKCRYQFQKKDGKKGKHYPHLQRAETRKCEICEKPFRAVNDHTDYKQRFCSPVCFRLYWSKSIRPRLKPTWNYGEKNHSWVGDEALYAAIHQRIEKRFGMPRLCEHCGSTTKSRYDWANIDHEYREDESDWMRLCVSCHRRYDIAQGIQGLAKEFRLTGKEATKVL